MSQSQSHSRSGDPVEVDPQHYQVEYENDRLRVLRVRFGPNEKSVMHSHPAGVAIILSDCDFKFNLRDAKSQNVVGTRGQVIGFDEAFEHMPENLSTKPFEALFVEVKEPA